MSKVLNTIIGSLDEKKEWREMERRAKALPPEYRRAYEEIKKYIWRTSGLETIKPFATILDLFEEGAANDKKVLDVVGKNVSDFADELVRGEKSYYEKMRAKLNNNLSN
jgi:DNA-binding ferritin-like protein (Dps family)